MAGREPAPNGLEVVRRFVNTLEVDVPAEHLATPEDLRGFFAEHGLMAPDEPVADADVERARAVREAIRAVLYANCCEDALDEDAIALLDATASDAELVVRFRADGHATLSPAQGGTVGALGKLFAIVLGAQADGTWERLKACKADDCRWAFYDRSKNHSSTWCSMEVCGSREKARQYRARKRA